MEEQTPLYKVLGIVIIAVTFLIIGIVAVVKWHDFAPEPQHQENQNTVFYSIGLEARHDGMLIDVHYQLKEGFLILAQGSTRSDSQELFGQAELKKNYTLVGYSDAYYIGQTECTTESLTCSVDLQKVADPEVYLAQVEPKKAKIYITQQWDSVIRQPIFCVRHTPNLLFVQMPLEEVEIPSHLQYQFDHCFMAPGDIAEPSTEWPITFEYDRLSDNEELAVLIMDRGIDENLVEQYAVGNMRDIFSTTLIK